MNATALPQFNIDNSETGCCPRFEPAGWDGGEFEFDQRRFLRVKTVSFLHVPLNIGAVFKKTLKRIAAAGAAPENEYLILSCDPSPWRGEHFFAVTQDVPGAEIVTISGRFLTKVFEGPFRDAGKWVAQMHQYVASQGQELKKLYFMYTTCPRCAKHFGKNYVVAFAQV